MNILRDIDICFISHVYMCYLVFVRGLKHDGPWLGKVFLPVRRRRLLFQRLRLRRENVALRLHKRLVCGGLHAPLVLEVTVESP
jgi:hypothetical protein